MYVAAVSMVFVLRNELFMPLHLTSEAVVAFSRIVAELDYSSLPCFISLMLSILLMTAYCLILAFDVAVVLENYTSLLFVEMGRRLSI